ncbi:hypothetical protein QN277_002372 [Acacia crassicarpa]|uniref:Uncharacterized protein n=1 Tax=Acacia crassicarpa TaxID=499986 RepID=A0AAE1N943_9FABA|nr:hypothetical protein QN277_002372 [Acacia crassicarpa]
MVGFSPRVFSPSPSPSLLGFRPLVFFIHLGFCLAGGEPPLAPHLQQKSRSVFDEPVAASFSLEQGHKAAAFLLLRCRLSFGLRPHRFSSFGVPLSFGCSCGPPSSLVVGAFDWTPPSTMVSGAMVVSGEGEARPFLLFLLFYVFVFFLMLLWIGDFVVVFSVVVWICDFGGRVVSTVDIVLHLIYERTILRFVRWWQIQSFSASQNLIGIWSWPPYLLDQKRKSVLQNFKGLLLPRLGFLCSLPQDVVPI